MIKVERKTKLLIIGLIIVLIVIAAVILRPDGLLGFSWQTIIVLLAVLAFFAYAFYRGMVKKSNKIEEPERTKDVEVEINKIRTIADKWEEAEAQAQIEPPVAKPKIAYEDIFMVMRDMMNGVDSLRKDFEEFKIQRSTTTVVDGYKEQREKLSRFLDEEKGRVVELEGEIKRRKQDIEGASAKISQIDKYLAKVEEVREQQLILEGKKVNHDDFNEKVNSHIAEAQLRVDEGEVDSKPLVEERSLDQEAIARPQESPVEDVSIARQTEKLAKKRKS